MMNLLDTFCGAGGATKGYQYAGFRVTGVDIVPSKHYVGDEFIQADALDYIRAHGHEYDVIHASPPCQDYSVLHGLAGQARGKLIPRVREALCATGRPYIIENVPGSQADLRASIVLCGLMFDLKVIRHRLFETSWLLLAPACPGHAGIHIGENGYCSVAGHGDSNRGRVPSDHRSRAAWRAAMGIEWMTMDELAQAIPPAYTEWIGRQVIKRLGQ